VLTTNRGNIVHFVIMGCGRVGSTLAHSLEDRGHTVAVIDTNPEAFRRLGPSFSGERVPGFGFDRAVLVAAGIERADAFAAVSSGDNSNIISARVARETFGIETVVARIYDPGRAEVYERLGIPTVVSVRWAADQFLRRLLPDGSEPGYRDPSGRVRVDVIPAPLNWVGTSIPKFEMGTGARVAFFTRLGEGRIPSDDTALQEGDMLNVAMLDKSASDVFAAIDAGPEAGG
jgi:trk system potassium uptake protein